MENKESSQESLDNDIVRILSSETFSASKLARTLIQSNRIKTDLQKKKENIKKLQESSESALKVYLFENYPILLQACNDILKIEQNLKHFKEYLLKEEKIMQELLNVPSFIPVTGKRTVQRMNTVDTFRNFSNISVDPLKLSMLINASKKSAEKDQDLSVLFRHFYNVDQEFASFVKNENDTNFDSQKNTQIGAIKNNVSGLRSAVNNKDMALINRLFVCVREHNFVELLNTLSKEEYTFISSKKHANHAQLSISLDKVADDLHTVTMRLFSSKNAINTIGKSTRLTIIKCLILFDRFEVAVKLYLEHCRTLVYDLMKTFNAAAVSIEEFLRLLLVEFFNFVDDILTEFFELFVNDSADSIKRDINFQCFSDILSMVDDNVTAEKLKKQKLAYRNKMADSEIFCWLCAVLRCLIEQCMYIIKLKSVSFKSLIKFYSELIKLSDECLTVKHNFSMVFFLNHCLYKHMDVIFDNMVYGVSKKLKEGLRIANKDEIAYAIYSDELNNEFVVYDVSIDLSKYKVGGDKKNLTLTTTLIVFSKFLLMFADRTQVFKDSCELMYASLAAVNKMVHSACGYFKNLKAIMSNSDDDEKKFRDNLNFFRNNVLEIVMQQHSVIFQVNNDFQNLLKFMDGLI